MKHRVVRLGQVVQINPSTKATGSADDLVAFLAMADITEEGRVASVQQRPLSEVQKGYTVFQAGDVLLAKITPCFENGKAALVESLPTQLGFGSTEFHVLRPTKEIVPKFLFHLVWNQNFRRLGASRMTGSAGQKRVPAAFLTDYEFLLPSPDEQQRIATILDKADSLRRRRREAIRLADELLKAVFFERFAAKTRSRVLTDYCDFLAGFAFKSDQYIEPRDGVRLLRGINVGIDRFEWGDSAGYPLGAVSDLAKYRLEEGDVVLAMDRPWISTGLKCAVVDERVAGSYLVQRVARLRPKQQGMSAFIMNCLCGNDFKSHCRITETTIPHISPKDFATFPVPTATDSELHAFSEIATRIQRVAIKAGLAATSTDELTSSLQATIFNMH